MPSVAYSCLITMYLAVVLLSIPCSCVESEKKCDRDKYIDSYKISKLYLAMERALVEGNHSILDQLGVAFLTDVVEEVHFDLIIIQSSHCVFNGGDSQLNCTSYSPICCRLPFYYYTPSAYMRLTSLFSSNDGYALWLALLHGNILPFSYIIIIEHYGYYSSVVENVDGTLYLDEQQHIDLEENLLLCSADDLFSWVSAVPVVNKCMCIFCLLLLYNNYVQIKLYAETRGVPETWNREQKGITSINPSEEDYESFDPKEINKYISDTETLLNLTLTEYSVVSLSVTLLVAKFFPAIHSQLVSSVTTLEYQSLYWGTAVVCNVFVYGLVFLSGRISAIYFLYISFNATGIVVGVLQVTYYTIFLLVSLFTAKSNAVAIPIGIGGVMINISFCWTFFCFCGCWSKQCKAKAVRVLVMFSFMAFIYHSIMELFSFGFGLLINVSETVTLTSLYIFSLFFFVFLSYYIIRATTKLPQAQNTMYYQNFLSIVANVFMLAVTFSAVMLIILIYMLLILKLQPRGISAVVSALLPPVILSAVGWYIKKKLQSRFTNDDDEEITSADSYRLRTDM